MWRTAIFASVLSVVIFSSALIAAEESEEYYYAIEQGGVISGYAHVVMAMAECDGRPCLVLVDSLWMQMTVLGKSIEGVYRFEYRFDAEDGMYFYHRSAIEQGGTKMGGIMEVRGDSMYITSDFDNDTSAVFLPPGTIRENTRIYKHLVNFFVRDTLDQKECLVFSERDGTVNAVTFINRGIEKLELEGRIHDVLAVEIRDRTTGLQTRSWLDPATGLLLKSSHPFRDTYLSDAGIKNRVGRADVADYFMVRTNKSISDPGGIIYMKVQGILQPAGLWLTPELLNVPGQKFEGTVQENRVNGVFEISHSRYDGIDSPPFPCDFSNIDSLQKYLKPSVQVESDDSSLIREAEEIVRGSKNAWEAATRLSRWVHQQIQPDIPGGGTALKTYQMRRGECGSHANLLTAFCRAAGIPARGVFGCMYIPDQGGGFGQHAWNEIYMGKAGWIPVDCTVNEVSYVDCGHVRLGEWVSPGATMANAEKMDILDYRLATDSTEGGNKQPAETRYQAYVGKYQGDRGELAIVVSQESLGLDIPGRNMIFELKDPDTSGNWYFKLSDAVSVSFEIDSTASVAAMTISEQQVLPRRATVDTMAVDSTVSEAYRPLLGEYNIPMQNASLGVIFQNGQLLLRLPGNEMHVLRRAELTRHWTADRGANTRLIVSFAENESGGVTGMKLITHSRCPRVVDENGK